MNNIKLQIIDEIEKHVDVFSKVSAIQYRIRCPECGDSQKNSRDAHCYIKCSYDPGEPLLYNCFKCNAGGRVTGAFLKKLGIKGDIGSKIDNQRYNKIASIKKLADVNIITGDPMMDSPQVRYIEGRLGKGLTVEDYDRFKIIWDLNRLYPFITDDRVRNSMPNNMDSVSFLSDDKSVLLVRYFSDDSSRWRKIKLFPSDNRAFYTIKSTIDLFTSEDIEVNIAEGIFDVFSIYKNFNNTPNSIFIATLGSDYSGGIEYAIAKGLIGSNVIINIYIDSDIDERSLKYKLKKYKWIFKEIRMFKNIKSKDVGVTTDMIKLVESKL